MDRQIARLLQNGEWLCPAAIVVSFGLALLICRKNKYFMPRNAWQWCAQVILLVVMLAGSGGYYFAFNANRAMDRRLHALTFKLLSDDFENRLSEYKGRVVLLNFW